MKRLAIVLAVGLALAGCGKTSGLTDANGNLTVGSVVSAAIVGVANPVTKRDLYTFENSMIIAFAALNAYKRSCIAGAVDAGCKDRIRAMQRYTRALPPALAQTRAFVGQNDQVNARTAFAYAKQLYADFRAIASAANIKVQ